MISIYYVILLLLYISSSILTSSGEELLLLAVATNITDGYERYSRSVKVNGLNSKTLGLGESWTGGDLNFPGGGMKVNLLKQALEEYKDRKDFVVMFTDSYDVIITGGEKEILDAFKSFNANVVFSAEDYCWPDKTLKEKYPKVIHGYKYLNSGGFIGYSKTLYKIMSRELNDFDDDQLYYTRIFFDLSTTMNIKLDNQAKIFQNLNGNSADVSLDFREDDTRLINNVYDSTPIVIHGNGPTKYLLNSLGNYLAKSWTKDNGCIACAEKRLNIAKESEFPLVLMGIFIVKPTPFLDDMFEKISLLNYPKDRIHLFLHNEVESYNKIVDSWLTSHAKDYLSLKNTFKSDIKEWHARNSAIQHCIDKKCDLYFNVDSEVHFDNPDTLNLLVSYNRPVLAPIIARVGKAWSNFWGAVTDDGFYARSSDYMDIVNYARMGIWNVPYISGTYVIWKSVLQNPKTRPNYVHKLMDADLAMPANFRTRDVFMYAVNLVQFGHLVNAETVTTKHLHNDLWQVAANPFDWQQRYIHPEYLNAVDPEKTNLQPCTDVYWMPLFTERFCNEMIEMMEGFGDWSGGKSNDPRLSGGYENVPTDDVHMNQVEYDQEFLFILKTYVKPLAEKVFIGYNSDARAILSFVVRYKPSEQFFLRPHHDSSTYSINIGLNKPLIDYEGGGARFIRYNCSVVNTRVGWGLLHPGRLTHYHEGLPTTKGTRYILVSFIDP